MPKTEPLTLKGCWEDFAKVAIPEHAPKAQHQAMYQAFLAGLDTLLQIDLSNRSITHGQSAKVLQKWREDVKAEIDRMSKETVQ